MRRKDWVRRLSWRGASPIPARLSRDLRDAQYSKADRFIDCFLFICFLFSARLRVLLPERFAPGNVVRVLYNIKWEREQLLFSLSGSQVVRRRLLGQDSGVKGGKCGRWRGEGPTPTIYRYQMESVTYTVSCVSSWDTEGLIAGAFIDFFLQASLSRVFLLPNKPLLFYSSFFFSSILPVSSRLLPSLSLFHIFKEGVFLDLSFLDCLYSFLFTSSVELSRNRVQSIMPPPNCYDVQTSFVVRRLKRGKVFFFWEKDRERDVWNIYRELGTDREKSLLLHRVETMRRSKDIGKFCIFSNSSFKTSLFASDLFFLLSNIERVSRERSGKKSSYKSIFRFPSMSSSTCW